MDSADLTTDQLQALLRQLKPHAAYLQALLDRMEQQKFDPIDRLRLRVVYAVDQVEALVQCLEGLATIRAKNDALWSAKSTREFKRRWRDQRNG